MGVCFEVPIHHSKLVQVRHHGQISQFDSPHII
jgi:hypothetical protein